MVAVGRERTRSGGRSRGGGDRGREHNIYSAYPAVGDLQGLWGEQKGRGKREPGDRGRRRGGRWQYYRALIYFALDVQHRFLSPYSLVPRAWTVGGKDHHREDGSGA